MLKKIINELEIELPTNKLGYQLNQFENLLLSLLKAFVSKSKLIIMNISLTEYFSYDYIKLTKTIDKLKSYGFSFITFSHNIDEIIDFSDRIIIFRDGGEY